MVKDKYACNIMIHIIEIHLRPWTTLMESAPSFVLKSNFVLVKIEKQTSTWPSVLVFIFFELAVKSCPFSATLVSLISKGRKQQQKC